MSSIRIPLDSPPLLSIFEVTPNRVAVNVTVFRAKLKETIFDQTSDDARRKAADRAVAQLINAGKIGRSDDLVWTV